MTFKVEIGFNESAIAAINELTAAIRALGQGANVSNHIVVEADTASAAKVVEKAVKNAAKESKEEPVTVHWLDNKAGKVGIVESEAEFKALKAENNNVVKTTPEKYKTKLAEIEAAKAPAKTKAPAPSVEDVIAAFSAYLPADLDKEERTERVAFVKPLLERFGAKKATELLEEHRALAINLVQRKMAGEDIDPESGEFGEVCEEAEESLV